MPSNPASPATCPQCGSPVPAGAAHGLCPRCVFARAMTATAGGAPIVPPDIEAVRTAFPQFEVLEFIGAGGMGAVFKVRQPKLDRFVALKILAPERADDPIFAERFAREAQALAALNHPHIVGVYDFGQAGGFYFLLMEYVDGVNLRQAMKAGRFTPEQALAVVPPVCEALQFAHEHGIVHRDIKPENLLLDKDGRVKIADFGIAKMLGESSTGVPPVSDEPTGGTPVPHSILAGTPQYMAPEQKAHRVTDHRADIYSLGVVLYELLTGELPADKLQPPSRKVQIDVRLDEIVLRALEVKPELRYQTAAEFRTQVETIAQTASPANAAPSPMGVTQPSYNPWIRLPRNVAISIAIFFAIVALVGLVGLVMWISYSSFNAPAGDSLAPTSIPQKAAATAAGESAPRQLSAAQAAQEGWRLWQSGQPSAAIAHFEKAVSLAPEDASAWNGLGWAQFNSGKTAEAEMAFQKTLTLDPNAAGALNGMGQILLARRDYANAETWLVKAAAQKASAAWSGLARLYLLQGKYADAEKWAQMIEDSGQGDAIATKMLEAAKAQRLSEGLRASIQPPEPTSTTGQIPAKATNAVDPMTAVEVKGEITQKEREPASQNVSVPINVARPRENIPLVAFALVTMLGRWLLMGGIAVALYIARRRTSLPGLGLMLAAAIGLLVLDVTSTFLAPWLARQYTPQEFGSVLQMRTLTDYALYAVGLVGVFSLLRSLRRPKT